MRGLRRSAMTALTVMLALQLHAVLVGYHGALALAVNVTVVVVNKTNRTIVPRVVCAVPGDPAMDFAAVPPNGRVDLSFKRDSRCDVFFGTECSRDKLGRVIDCSSGNCSNEGCTLVDKPVATMINHDNGTVTVSGPYGCNFPLRVEFLSADSKCSDGKCKCSPVSCNCPLSKCPEGLRILEESSGLPVACKAWDKERYCQGRADTSCNDGVILMVTVSEALQE